MLFSRLLSKPVIQLQPATWDSPKECLGTLVGPLRGGRYQCWEAVGRARAVFRDLSTEIKEYLEASTISTCDIISWSMYMIGRTPETAAPKVLICSINAKLRRSIRKSIENSGIMVKYPGVGLGDTSTLPDRHVIRLLSRETIRNILLLRKCEPELAVLVESTWPKLKPVSAPGRKVNQRRAFVVNPADFSLRPITLGPIVAVGGKRYLLTAAHAFSTNRNPSEPESQYQEAFYDCSFDGMSDDEDEVDLNTLETESSSSLPTEWSAMRNPFTNTRRPTVPVSLLNYNHMSDGEDDIDLDTHETQSSSSSPTEWSGMRNLFSNTRRLRVPISLSNHSPIQPDQGPDDVDVSRLRFYGKLALSSATGNRPSLDYALVEEKKTANPPAYKIQQLEPQPVRVDEIGTIGTQDVNIIAYLGKLGEAYGHLTATPTYIYLPGWRYYQEVYPIRLQNHQFCAGDSGAGVFGHDGRFYGHVVAGGPGTNIAYIVPALYTMADIHARLRQKSSSFTLNLINYAFLGILSPDVSLGDPDITLSNIKLILRDIFHHFSTSKVTLAIFIAVFQIHLFGRCLGLFDNNQGWRWILGNIVFHLTSTLPLALVVATAYIAGRLENYPPRASVILNVVTLCCPPVLLLRYSVVIHEVLHEVDGEGWNRFSSFGFHLWSISLICVAVILVFMGGNLHDIIRRQPRPVQGEWARKAQMTKT